ncbi:hypothetical protein HBE96_25065 [Clostridium sp. P21]|uniref:Pre-toxin TG domain-containing protein n=1 Tax=Clostridium muellerianum TaxID=2716538 RepID=A0A7Y0HSH8_9CLOT|nr:pre-toxin TG domain-containing protein [Clostridium muellerianum]NMM65853.1 hypothetical protein [Clostridium muellerianum]
MVKTFKLDENTINDKGQTGYEVTDKILEHLKKADSLMEDAYAEINRHEDLAYVQYNSLSSDCTKISDYSRDYKDFKRFTNEYNENVDSIFFKAQEEAMKYLRDVRLEEIELDNNLGIKQMYTSHYPGLEGQGFVKSKINIKDLLECGDVDKALKEEFQQQQLAIKKLKELAELPKEKWPQGMTDERMEKIRAYVKQLKEAKEDQESYDDSIKKLITSGELDYETKGERITSMVLDCIPIVGDIKGIAEVAIGKDLVSGRRFSDTERAIMLGATIIGFSQVGKVGKVALKLGGKELLKEGVKCTVKETAKNLVMVETFEGLSKLGKNLGLDPKAELGIMAGIVIGGGKLHTKVQNYIKDVSKEMKGDSLNSIIKDIEVEGTAGKNLSNIESEVKDIAKDASNGKILDDINTASKSSTMETVAKDADDIKNIKDEATGMAKDGVSAESKLDTVSKYAKDNIKSIKDESTGIAKDGLSGESKLDTISKDTKELDNVKNEAKIASEVDTVIKEVDKGGSKAGVGKTGEGIPLEEVKPDVLRQIHPDDNGAYGYLPNEGTAYHRPKYDFTNVDWAKDMQNVRKDYLEASKQLSIDIERMTSEGFSKKDIAKHVVDARNQQKVTARAKMTVEERAGLEERNIEIYGNLIGPDSQWLFNKTKKKLIKEGTYINDDEIWSSVIKKSMKKDDVINTLLGIIH